MSLSDPISLRGIEGVGYVAEGAANLLIELYPVGLFPNKLLRLQKAVSTQSHDGEAQLRYYEQTLVPLLGRENLVGIELAHLDLGQDLPIPVMVNKMLAEAEARGGIRAAKWTGSRAAGDVDCALLVEDLRPDSVDNDFTTFEFKPKWLAPSPGRLPLTADRCRECAKSAMMTAANPDLPSTYRLCPLDFVRAVDGLAPDEAVERIVAVFSDQLPTPESRASFARWVGTTDLFSKLRDLQVKYDPDGVLEVQARRTEARLDSLSVAMTLRDCGCFVKVPLKGTGRVVVKLIDLDRKDGNKKLGVWAKLQSDLVEGGFYESKATPRPSAPECQLFGMGGDR